MGAWTSKSELQQAASRAEARVGRIPIGSRFHRLPRRLEDDYFASNQVLGTGCSGCVLLAINRHTKTQVAVKRLRLRGIGREMRHDLVSEVEVFLGMDHPHVTRLMEVYEDEDSLSLVMELLEGGELLARLSERGYFQEDDAAEATRQMLLAVSYLHSQGVVHRDLKLENFLFEKEGSDFLKLIDFGFSKIVANDAKMDLSCGTITYLAPEVLNRCYTRQCDLWSLGVMVFGLLCGHLPFDGSTDRTIMKRIRGGIFSMQARPWNRVSKDGKDFVQSLLVVSPEGRLTAQQAQQHPWIAKRGSGALTEQLDRSVADAICSFAREPRFRQSCLQLMAWSLGKEERAQVREAFLRLDKSRTGVIKLTDLKKVLEESFQMAEALTGAIVCSDGNFRYSDFLAAMIPSRIAVRESVLRDTFRRFDVDGSGCITRRKLQQVLGRPAVVEEAFDELDLDRDGRITTGELMGYLSGGTRAAPPSEQEPRRRRSAPWRLGCMAGVGRKLRARSLSV